MLEIAREESLKYGHNIKLCECPAEKLDVEDKSIDVVVCKQLLHETQYPEKVVSEMCRVVKPDGKVFIIDFDANGNKVAARLIQSVIRMTGGKNMAAGFRKSFHAGLPGRIIADYLKEYGLQHVEYHKRGVDYFIMGQR
jgi:ubiquinone/menaquinone biosynthesis C-methylase UbiE